MRARTVSSFASSCRRSSNCVSCGPITDQLRALVTHANPEGVSDATWGDGECLRVRYDILVPSDESHDGVEECVVDVLAALVPGPRATSSLMAGKPGVIRATDAPVCVVAGPDSP